MKEIYKLLSDWKLDKKYWDKISLTDEDYNIRSNPAPYIKKAIEIAKILDLKITVEIGSARFAVSDKCIEYFKNCEIPGVITPGCCMDGHCGFFFADNNFELYTVDIDENCLIQNKWSFENLRREFPTNIHLCIPEDGIEFLTAFNKKIDVLILDGWDVGTHEYAQRHLDAFIAAQDKLSETHLILIDDTDFRINKGGKDGLLTPKLIELNYIPLFTGRQSLFINKSDVKINMDIFNEITTQSEDSFEPEQIHNSNDYEYDNSNFINNFPNPKKVILSLTTIPSRLNEIREGWGFKPVIKKLLDLSYTNYEVHLNLPYISSMTNEPYSIPNWLEDLEKNNDKLKIYRTNDYGSITKIAPTILRTEDPETIIITVDDDMIYMDGFIQYLLKKEEIYANSAIGFAGLTAYDGTCHFCTTVKKDTKVKILEGYKSVLYKRKFFSDDFFTDFVGKSWNDDLLISSHLGKNRIDRYVVNYIKDYDFSARVESFPVIGTVPNDKSGCSLFREKNVDDQHTQFYKKYLDL
jgi:hypothetical protein